MYPARLQKFFTRKKIKIGDRISLKSGKNVFSGILMPRTAGGECIILKLENGYNIGLKYGRSITIKKVG